MAETSSAWRTWDTSDGFEESYTGGVELGPDGKVWVKHGAVGLMNLLDGYTAPKVPDPKGTGLILSAGDGTLWLWTGNDVKRFRDSVWTSYPSSVVFGNLKRETGDSLISVSRHTAAALDPNHVLLLLPGKILEFDAEKRQSRMVLTAEQAHFRRFSGIRPAGGGRLLVSGQGGVGVLTGKPEGQWRFERLPAPPARYVDFEEPFDWPGKGVLVTATTPGWDTAALGFENGRWRELYKGESKVLRVWPGEGGSVWISDGNRVLELSNGTRRYAERNGALMGTPVTVAPEGPGRFWIGTSQGLAHHMPVLWQTPADAPGLDEVVNAITEDRAGRVWFLAARHLLCLDGAKWTSYPLPKGEEPWTIFTEGLASMKDGRLAIGTTSAHLLLFDPRRRIFLAVDHPEKRRTHTFAARPDGSLLVETYAAGSKTGGTLDVFDGTQFTTYLRPRKAWGKAELRSLQISPDGDIWTGGTQFFGVYHGNELHVIDQKEGFADPGAYVMHCDASGQMLAGGRDGLFERRGRKWERIQSGLDRIRSIVRGHDGTVWIASGTGVHRWQNGVWLSNTMEEGLPSAVTYKVFEDSRGRIWAGTASGLSLFHPEADTDPPRIQLAKDQNERETSPEGQIRIVFSAVDKWKFTPSSRLLFSYRLDGGAWSSYSPASFASFEKLRAGKHRFEVRAMDRNGNISSEIAIHQFSVLLPWYSTIGFRLTVTGCGALVAFLLGLAIRSYAHRGSLIRELFRKGQLEQDRQTILQMIAARESPSAILQRVTALAAANCPGSTCLVIRVRQAEAEFFCQPAVSARVQAVIHQLDGAEDRPEPGTAAWWRALDGIAPGPAGDIALVRVNSGEERLGALLLFTGQPEAIASVYGWLGTFSDLAAAAIENAGLYERLEHQAMHDALTGMPNRHYFENLLALSIAEAKVKGHRLAVLFLDLDRFKQINDTFGHRVGDLFLKQVANRLAGALQAGESLARIGGDEFTVLVDGVQDKSSIEQLGATLLDTLRHPVRVEDHDLFASASIGISFFPDDGDNALVLQKNADAAMYRAKAEGRNQVKLFAAEMGLTGVAAFGVERLLRWALDEKRLELHYQPQFTVSGGLAGMEALLRLRGENGEYLSTASLIRIAEETGLIFPIGSWVLREACRQLREWLDEGFERTRMSINISAVQLGETSFADEVAQVLAEYRLDPGLIELELTESAMMRNTAITVRQTRRLRKLGVRITIDDFGAGHSSLAYLQTLPINGLKINRTFVHRITRPGGLHMVKAIMALAANLEMTVIAEGVETANQHAALRACGCQVLQGYLLCRPQPPSSVRSYLSRPGPGWEVQEDTAIPVA